MHHRAVSIAVVGAALLSVPAAVAAQTLRGSPSAVERAYERATARGLYFYQTTKGVRSAASKGRLVPLAGNADYQIQRVSHPYATPTTRTFVERLGAQYRAGCGERLFVTSAARPRSRRLANSSELSVHPTGTAVDLRKPSGACLRWLRRTLLELEAKGVIDATEERSPPHFHVAVFNGNYERYLASMGVKSPAATSGSVASVRQYTVRRGDSFWSIANRFDTTVTVLQRLNPGKTARILPGERLRIPG